MGEGTAPRGVVELSQVPFADVLLYDRSVSPSVRPLFLDCWIHSPGTFAVGVKRAGRLAGFGVMRPCRNGYRIGPLLGDNEQIADGLFTALSARVASAPLFLDVPEANSLAVSLARRHGMREQFAVARMYNKAVPELPLERVFGATSMEVG